MRLLKSLFYHLIDTFRTYKEKGVWAGLTKLSQTILHIFYSRDEFVVLTKPLSESQIIIEPLPDLVIRRVEKNEDLSLMDSLTNAADAARFRQMFDTGSIVFNAFEDGQLAGWGWISREIKPEIGRVQAPLQPGDACLHDLFVVPKYRGRNIAQQLVAGRLQYLREHNFKRSVITCSKDNIPALKVAQKAGYYSIGESYHVRFLFWDRFEFNPYDQ